MRDPQSATLDVKSWVVDVISWDGLLPIATFSISLIAAAVFRDNHAPATILLIALPIIGVLIRFTIGRNRICSNHCRPKTRVLQFICLALALLMYMFFDFFVVLNAIVPDKPVFDLEDLIFFSCLGSIYFSLAAVAMYPGRSSRRRPPDFTAGTWPIVLEWCHHGGDNVLLVKCTPTRQLIAYCPHCCGAWLTPADIDSNTNNYVNPIDVAQGFAYPTFEDIADSEWYDHVIGSTDEWSLDELNGDFNRLTDDRNRVDT